MTTKQSGFIFLEIIIAVALINLVLITLLGISLSTLNISYNIQQAIKADRLTKEAFERVRAFRDNTTWTNFTTVNFGSANSYSFSLSGGNWVRSSGSQTVGGSFTRSIVFDQVYRDGSGNIAQAGTLDSATVKVTVTLTSGGKTWQTSTYLTNWQNR